VPSPVGHFLFGLATHVSTASAEDLGWRARTAVTVACALAPDLDFLAGLWGVRWHQRHTHSIGAAVIAAALVAIGSRIAGSARWRSLGLAAWLGWMSHLALDFVNVDTHPPIGIMALWPFSTAHYKFPWPVFMDIGRTLDWKTARHDALALAWEAALLCPLLVFAWRRRTRPRR
jgi:membrane-bound metal-dependent hydrolase YbcI (DUF457 family)